MARLLILFSIILCGCGFKSDYVIPDKFAFQVNADPNKDGAEFVDQIRFGLSWDIPQLDD